MSLPHPRALPSMANKAAHPPEEPPEVCASLYGFNVRPHNGFTHSKNINVWGTLDFTKGIPPASRTNRTSCNESAIVYTVTEFTHVCVFCGRLIGASGRSKCRVIPSNII